MADLFSIQARQDHSALACEYPVEEMLCPPYQAGADEAGFAECLGPLEIVEAHRRFLQLTEVNHRPPSNTRYTPKRLPMASLPRGGMETGDQIALGAIVGGIILGGPVRWGIALMGLVKCSKKGEKKKAEAMIPDEAIRKAEQKARQIADKWQADSQLVEVAAGDYSVGLNASIEVTSWEFQYRWEDQILSVHVKNDGITQQIIDASSPDFAKTFLLQEWWKIGHKEALKIAQKAKAVGRSGLFRIRVWNINEESAPAWTVPFMLPDGELFIIRADNGQILVPAEGQSGDPIEQWVSYPPGSTQMVSKPSKPVEAPPKTSGKVGDKLFDGRCMLRGVVAVEDIHVSPIPSPLASNRQYELYTRIENPLHEPLRIKTIDAVLHGPGGTSLRQTVSFNEGTVMTIEPGSSIKIESSTGGYPFAGLEKVTYTVNYADGTQGRFVVYIDKTEFKYAPEVIKKLESWHKEGS